jgi:hypothetical protein
MLRSSIMIYTKFRELLCWCFAVVQQRFKSKLCHMVSRMLTDRRSRWIERRSWGLVKWTGCRFSSESAVKLGQRLQKFLNGSRDYPEREIYLVSIVTLHLFEWIMFLFVYDDEVLTLEMIYLLRVTIIMHIVPRAQIFIWISKCIIVSERVLGRVSRE